MGYDQHALSSIVDSVEFSFNVTPVVIKVIEYRGSVERFMGVLNSELFTTCSSFACLLRTEWRGSCIV